MAYVDESKNGRKNGTMAGMSESDMGSTWNSGLMSKLYPAGCSSLLVPLLKLAWPIVIIQFTQFTFASVALIFCGHLGKVELDAVALSNSFINVTGISIAVGLSSACDTLFSQIYGSTNKKLAGVVLQRSLLILLVMLLPCWAIHLNMESLLVSLGQDPEVSKLAGQYIFIFMPAMFFYFVYSAIIKYLQNQNVVFPSMIIGIVANLVNALLHYVFIYVLEAGTVGSAISQMLSYSLMCILNVLYILISKVYKETWDGWSAECFQDWGNFFKLAISGLLMICIEWWSFESGILLSGLLGTTELGAQSILFQFDALYYMLPLGISVSVSIMTGQFLGGSQPVDAKTIARIGLTLALMTGVVCGVITATCRNYLPYIFTTVPEVIEMVSGVLPVLGCYMIFSACVSVSGGVVRGVGRQHVGAIIVFVNYAIALAAGIPAMLLSEQIIGFWIALAGSLFLCSCAYLVMIGRTDWDLEVIKAQERAKVDSVVDSKDENDASERTALLGGEEKVRRVSGMRPRGPSWLGGETSVKRRSSSVVHYNEMFGATSHRSSSPPLSSSQLIIRRSALTLFCLAIFITGIFCRIFVPVPEVNSGNNTMTTMETSTDGNFTTPSFTTLFTDQVWGF